MLRNYFKIAIAVLRRRKFFTFISLFGISFTLTILMVTTAFIDKVASDTYPDRKRDRTLYITNLEERGEHRNNSSSGPLSFYFLDHYGSTLKTPVDRSIFSGFNGTNTYVNGRKILLNYKYTDAAYWKILEYEFLEGKPYTKEQVANRDLVTVITEDMKRDYFGDGGPVVGKMLEADNVKYRVIGVVKNLPVTTYMLYSDIYLPYTVSKEDYKSKGYRGSYNGILLARSAADVPAVQKEYLDMIKKAPMEEKQYEVMYSHANPYLQAYVTTGNEESSGFFWAIRAITIFVLLVTVLPTLNLVNINITRIMERSSEIGVRKAFGASSRTLVYQFIVENMILTFLGGLIGVVFSWIVLQVLNHANLIANLELGLDLPVLFYSLVTCVFFGLLSGVYPAWRMSKLNVVTALKG